MTAWLPFQCLTWRLPLPLILALQRLEVQTTRLTEATITAMKRRSSTIAASWRAHSRLWQKSRLIKNPRQLRFLRFLQPRKTNSLRAHGSARLRQSFAGSGCRDFRARTRWRNRVADSHTDRKSCRRKRLLADSTWHQSVRISSSTHPSARSEPGVFSNTLLTMSRLDSHTQLWWAITRGTPQWDCSRRSITRTFFT